MTQSRTVSAREAARRLGFKSTNSVLTAIRDGELPAIRSEARVRNGRNNATYRIDTADLVRWAEKRGLEGATEPSGEPVDLPATLTEAATPTPIRPEVKETFEVCGHLVGREFGSLVCILESGHDGPHKPEMPQLESNVSRVLLPGVSVAADRLELLSKLVLAGQFDAARLVVETWG